MHITTGTTTSLDGKLTFDEKVDWIHNVLSPAIYKFGSASYYSESDWSLDEGEWQTRFWDTPTYEKLMDVKRKWDPEMVFGCRHCVGYGEEAGEADEKTLPTWRRPQ